MSHGSHKMRRPKNPARLTRPQKQQLRKGTLPAAILAKLNGRKYEVGRFKGLGEMNPETLKETTMNPKTRTLMRVQVLDHKATDDVFDRLMGKDPKARFTFIQERAEYAELDI